MTNANKKLIRELIWVEAIIAMFIVTLIFGMIGSNRMFTMFIITSFAIYGFSFSVCEEKDEGRQ